MRRAILSGSAWTVGGIFPVAALVALVYRFPIPFAGYQRGPAAAMRSLLAVALYGATGGFIALAALGAVAGAVAFRLTGGDQTQLRRATIAAALAIDLAAALLLATLDRVVGPW